LTVDVSVCLRVYVCVCVSATLNISEIKRFTGLCPIGSLQESVYGASIGDVIDDVT